MIYLIETHMEDHNLIHILDFIDGMHLIQECSCHQGTHQLQFDLNQLVNCHIGNFNIQDMWRILIMTLTSKFSKKKSKLMGRLWKLISSTYLVSFYETIFQSGAKTLYEIILIAPLRNWSKHCTILFELWKTIKKSFYVVEKPPTTSW